MAIGLAQPELFTRLLKVLPQLHHSELMNLPGGAQDPTQGAVEVMTHERLFRTWPQVWAKHSSTSFSLPNTLFWQSYFALLLARGPPERVTAALREGAEHLCGQPAGEPEYRAAFCELFAGALRALRKEDSQAALVRAQAW